MKMLYGLARRLQFPQNTSETPEPAVLSVYYGAERTFAYTRYPLWFKRTVDVEAEHQNCRRPMKRPQGNGEDGTRTGAEEGKRKRKIRGGKQVDVGSLLGSFG